MSLKHTKNIVQVNEISIQSGYSFGPTKLYQPSITNLLYAFREIEIPTGTKKTGEYHEDLIGKIIHQHGFVEFGRELTTQERQEWRDTGRISSLGIGQYVTQPFGSQDSPDYIVCDSSNDQRGIECKSTKGFQPKFNGGFPKPDVIYVITTTHKKIERKTRLLEGRHIVPDELRSLLRNYKIALKEFDTIWNAKISKLLKAENPFGLGVFSRGQDEHKSTGGSRINYFGPEAELMEQELLSKFTEQRYHV